jgi:peptide/nickel transport system ATP-binding protein
VLRIGDQIVDAIVAHEPCRKHEAMGRAAELLHSVGLEQRHLRSYPHELSGGMRQRAVIAMALALHPSLLLMDEPTTALDVVTQQAILSRVLSLRQRVGCSVILVTHDLPLLIQLADRVAVMYAGRVVEIGSAQNLKDGARHPYTQALMRAFPALRYRPERLATIPGSPPDLRADIVGCPFADRCPYAIDYCRTHLPPLASFEGGRAACHLVTGAIGRGGDGLR